MEALDIAYPSGVTWRIRALRFMNMLDDTHNMMSPVKMNLWSANMAGFSTALAAGIAWVSGHWGMLEHVGQIGSVVGPYLGGSHVAHHFDKSERNKQIVRLKQAERQA